VFGQSGPRSCHDGQRPGEHDQYHECSRFHNSSHCQSASARLPWELRLAIPLPTVIIPAPSAVEHRAEEWIGRMAC
jgi:hypothetical protein